MLGVGDWGKESEIACVSAFAGGNEVRNGGTPHGALANGGHARAPPASAAAVGGDAGRPAARADAGGPATAPAAAPATADTPPGTGAGAERAASRDGDRQAGAEAGQASAGAPQSPQAERPDRGAHASAGAAAAPAAIDPGSDPGARRGRSADSPPPRPAEGDAGERTAGAAGSAGSDPVGGALEPCAALARAASSASGTPTAGGSAAGDDEPPGGGAGPAGAPEPPPGAGPDQAELRRAWDALLAEAAGCRDGARQAALAAAVRAMAGRCAAAGVSVKYGKKVLGKLERAAAARRALQAALAGRARGGRAALEDALEAARSVRGRARPAAASGPDPKPPARCPRAVRSGGLAMARPPWCPSCRCAGSDG